MGVSVYLEEKSLEKFSTNQTNVHICSYGACCGRGKQWCMQRQGGVCLLVGIDCTFLSRYPFSIRCRTNGAVALEWKDATGSEHYESLRENYTAVQFSSLN